MIIENVHIPWDGCNVIKGVPKGWWSLKEWAIGGLILVVKNARTFLDLMTEQVLANNYNSDTGRAEILLGPSEDTPVFGDVDGLWEEIRWTVGNDGNIWWQWKVAWELNTIDRFIVTEKDVWSLGVQGPFIYWWYLYSRYKGALVFFLNKQSKRSIERNEFECSLV